MTRPTTRWPGTRPMPPNAGSCDPRPVKPPGASMNGSARAPSEGTAPVSKLEAWFGWLRLPPLKRPDGLRSGILGLW